MLCCHVKKNEKKRIPVSSGHVPVVFPASIVFVWFQLILFPSVCVMFRIPVAHLAPLYEEEKMKTDTSSSNKRQGGGRKEFAQDVHVGLCDRDLERL